jgi:hypothetical protein
MRDRYALLLCAGICSVAAWASWRWWGEHITFALLVLLLVAYAVDNFQLRKQVRGLLAERDRRERAERKRALFRVMQSLLAVREKKAGTGPA